MWKVDGIAPTIVRIAQELGPAEAVQASVTGSAKLTLPSNVQDNTSVCWGIQSSVVRKLIDHWPPIKAKRPLHNVRLRHTGLVHTTPTGVQEMPDFIVF